MAAEPSAKCVWLTVEGLRLEARAAELDRGGGSNEAAVLHKVASAKLSEAAALCPEGHPDRPLLEERAQELSLRAIYLESLGGAPASLPFEDHVGEDLTLTMDVSRAAPPEEEAVPALLARGGASGDSAPLTEEGYQMVAALDSAAEAGSFISRVLAAEGRRTRQGMEAELQLLAEGCRGALTVRSLADLQGALRCADWVELDIHPNQDKMELAVQLEKEARLLDQQLKSSEAIRMYDRSLVLFHFVHKHDPRSKNPKIKDMVGQRIAELEARVEALRGADLKARVEALGAGP